MADRLQLAEQSVERLESRHAYLAIKRGFDVAFSLGVLGLFWWLYLGIAVAIRLDSPGPALFIQTRVGKNGREFRMYKFRSMCEDAEERLAELRQLNERDGPTFKIREDPRITRVGKFIRRTSLDELPQFVNVLKGQMSVVGPRPPLPREVEHYDELQRVKFRIRPGITCFWQVHPERDLMSFDDWVSLDLDYIEQCGIDTDLLLVFRTIRSIIRAEGS